MGGALDRVEGWSALQASLGLTSLNTVDVDAVSDDPDESGNTHHGDNAGGGAAPWTVVVATAAAWLRGDMAVAMNLIGAAPPAPALEACGAPPCDVSRALAAIRSVWMSTSQSRQDLGKRARSLAGLTSRAATGLTDVLAAVAAMDADGGGMNQRHAAAAAVELAGVCVLGSADAVVRAAAAASAGAEQQARLEGAMATLLAPLLGRWAARLGFERDDMQDAERARIDALREKQKERKMAVAQRLDESGRGLIREMKKVRPGGVDWDAVERDLAAAEEHAPDAASGGVEGVLEDVQDDSDDGAVRDEDGMDAFWSS